MLSTSTESGFSGLIPIRFLPERRGGQVPGPALSLSALRALRSFTAPATGPLVCRAPRRRAPPCLSALLSSFRAGEAPGRLCAGGAVRFAVPPCGGRYGSSGASSVLRPSQTVTFRTCAKRRFVYTSQKW